MQLPPEIHIKEFLRESNAIEGVFDEESFDDAMLAWDYLFNQDVLTPDVICGVHRILMQRQPLAPDEIGQFRKVGVTVGGRPCLPSTLVPSHILMQFCFETMRANPAPDWQALHVVYEKIHPFVDGNGRTGRMFMNWTRIKRCDWLHGTNLGILVLKADERHEYYKWFR